MDFSNPLPAHVWCDFNACGWSGTDGDDCYYVFALDDLSTPPENGMQVLLYDWEDEAKTEVLAQVANLEKTDGGWRARPTGDFYSGRVPW